MLFDHNMPLKLRRMLPGHYIQAANEMGWDRLGNGTLLSAAEAAGFQVMITADQNLSYQQNLDGRKLSLIVLSTNRLRSSEKVLVAYLRLSAPVHRVAFML